MKNFLIFLFPLSLSDLTQFIGVGILIIFFLLIMNDFQNKKIILTIFLTFIIIYTIAGQKSPRFYLEIYFLLVLTSSFLITKISNNYFFRLFKIAIIFQCFILFVY